MNNGTLLSYYDSEMASKKNKNRCTTFEKIYIHCYSLKIDDDAPFKNRSKIPDFVLRLLNSMLNFEVDRLFLHHLEYEIYCTDYLPITIF